MNELLRPFVALGDDDTFVGLTRLRSPSTTLTLTITVSPGVRRRDGLVEAGDFFPFERCDQGIWWRRHVRFST